MIPQPTIERVAAANDIVEVINAVVPLKRMGARWRALCPFHREKTPSFYVDPARQNYKCFGCGAGGSVFGFIMAHENLDFPGAVRRLAERAGIVLDEEELRGGEADTERSLKKRLIGLHAEAADWFHRHLLKNPAAQPARDYLRARGIDREIALHWKLGYAPDAWSELRDWGREAGYALEEMLTAGLVVAREDDGGEGERRGRRSTYDRFRDRLMIPICNEQGEVIAFSGRVLAAEAKAAKYVNSPETPIFTKGAVLFGLHKSRRPIIEAGRAIVCEGQLDLITAFEHGITNVTAPQGTAFTPKQAALLRRCCEEVVLCFDADAAGQQAAERSFAALLEANVSVRVATMPPGEDPDSMIRGQGAEAFRERIREAKDFFDFQIERLSGMYRLDEAAGQASFARRLAESVRLVSDNFLREAVAGKVAARLGVSAERFRELVARTPRRNLHQEDAAVQLAERRVVREERFAPAVVKLLVLAAREPTVLAWLAERERTEKLLGQIEGGRHLQRALAETRPGGLTAEAFLESLGLGANAAVRAALELRPVEKPLEDAQEAWLLLTRELVLREVDAINARLASPELSGEEMRSLSEQLPAALARLKALNADSRSSGIIRNRREL